MNNLQLAKIAKIYGTPTYVYDISTLRNNLNYFSRNAYHGKALVAVAMKANSNLHLLEAVAEAGLGVDAVSMGEIKLAIKAGIGPEKIVFSGVGKTEGEIRFAIEKKILFLNVESEEELDLICKIAEEKGEKVHISFRLNPDVTIDSNPKIATGGKQHKFGLSLFEVVDLCKKYATSKSIHVGAIHAHIGSQIFEKKFFDELKAFFSIAIPKIHDALGYRLNTINFGGGFGVDNHGNTPEWVSDWMTEAVDFAKHHGCSAIFEPGRSIFAVCGVLLTDVVRIKRSGSSPFVIVDAGMNDFMRTALYGATHPFSAVRESQAGTADYDIVGPVCESTDVFASKVPLPIGMKAGDLIRMDMAGAYGFSMSSQYNMRCRPAEVLIDVDGSLRLSRRRETFEDLTLTTCQEKAYES